MSAYGTYAPDTDLRAWTAEQALKHPRNPAGPGGGRFRSGVAAAVRDVLSAAQTTEQISAAFEAEAERLRPGLPKVRCDLNRMHPQTAREHAEGVLRCLERFPNVDLEWVSRFGTGRYPDAANTYAYVQGNRMRFNERYWSGPGQRDKYLLSLKESEESRWHPPGTNTPMGVAVHEFGHILDNSLGNDAYLEVWRTLQRRVEPGHSQSGIAREISDYAAENMQELVAEAFADVMINGDGATPASREIFDILAAEYDKAGR